MSPRRWSRTLLLCALLGASSSFAASWISDGWIDAKAKIALLTSGWVVSDVSVDVVDGRVSLYGEVGSEEDRKKAEEIVSQVQGVRSVRNLLRVAPPKGSKPAAVSDAAIRRAVEQALGNDVRLVGTRIRVMSVKDGVVQLGGEARHLVEHLRALQVARRVRGVRRVASQVRTAEEDAGVDIWSRHELRQDGRGILDAASDLWLTAETRLRLIADPRVPAPDINVDCYDETITLFGTVPSAEAKRAAEEDARAIAGVRRVRNELQIVPAKNQAKVEAKDEELEEEVEEAIEARPEMKHASVKVSVRNGVVRLSGTAPSHQHRLFAATTARSVPGVRAVEQDIRVTSVTEEQR